MTAVTVLGLGRLGRAVATTLLTAGVDVTVWNRTHRRAQGLLARRGAVVATTAAGAVATAPLVILALTDYEATNDVLSSAGVVDALAGRTLVQLAIGRPEESRALESLVNRLGARYLDGSLRSYPHEIGTEDGRLVVAGSRDAFLNNRAVFEKLGKTQYLGDDVERSAHLVNAQAALGEIMIVGYHEALAYAAGQGVTLADMVDGLSQTLHLVQRTVIDTIAHLERNPEGLVRATLASIDIRATGLGHVVEAMTASGARADVASAALSTLEAAEARGLGSYEVSALVGLRSPSMT